MAFSIPSFSKLSDLTKLVSSKPRSVLGIDIGSSSIKVVQLRRERGKAILETYGAVALGPYGGVEIGRATQLAPQKIVEALTTILKEANVTANDAGIAIPYSSSLITVVKLPVAVEDHLSDTMPLEARKYIPVPITEVKLDWTLVAGGKAGGGKEGELEVMLVAIHNETIEKYRRIAADAKLQASFFEIEVFSAVRACLDRGIAPVAVVDFGAAITKFYVVERGIVRESHLLNRGSQELTLNASRALNIGVAQAEERKRKEGLSAAPAQGAPPDASVPPAALSAPGSNPALAPAALLARSFELSLDPLMNDLSRTVSSYEQRMNETIGTVVFTGGGSTLKGFGAYAQSKLQTQVALADPFNKVEAPAFLDPVLKEAGPEFSVAVGLALRRLQEIG